MKERVSYCKLLALGSLFIVALTSGWSAKADCFWRGWYSSDWSDPYNWDGGFPTNAASGNTIVLASDPPWALNPCVVSNAGNYVVWGVYLGDQHGGLTVVSGGELSITNDLTTGVWAANDPVNVIGGQITINGYLNMGAGGYDGKVNISSGGTVESGHLQINTIGGAKLNISTNGTYITAISQWTQVTNYITSSAMVANNGAAGWSINVATNVAGTKLVLTSVFVPPSGPINYVFSNGGGDNIWTNHLNWSPAGQPGESDTATVGGGLTAILNSGAEGHVSKLLVGSTNGAGTVNFNSGCSVSFRDTSISILAGGVTNSGGSSSSCIFNGGSVSTMGDLLLGGNGGRVQALHYSGSCVVGGTLRLGSYLYPGDASPTNASLRLIGANGGFSGMAAIEIGNAGTLSYEFNGGSAIKTLTSGGAISILAGARLVVDGTGFSGVTTDIALLKGSTVTGTFTTVVLTNFPSSVTASVSYTATRVKLSLANTQPGLGLSIQSLGSAMNRITWTYGNIETATSLAGPWTLQQCATSPLTEAAAGSQKFYRGILFGTTYVFDNEAGNNQWGYTANWNPDGLPGPSDDAVIDSGITCFLITDVGTVGSATVGKAVGNGSFEVQWSGTVVFTNPCKSVIIGGASGAANNYYRHGNWASSSPSVTTYGDFVMGSSGGGADAQLAAGTLRIGGRLQLGSFNSPAYSLFDILGGLGTVSASGLEIGSVGELKFTFNGDSTLTTVVVSGPVNLLPGSKQTINGTSFVGSSGIHNYTLIQGGTRTGTFGTVNITGFSGGTTAAVTYSGANVNLTVTVP